MRPTTMPAIPDALEIRRQLNRLARERAYYRKLLAAARVAKTAQPERRVKVKGAAHV